MRQPLDLLGQAVGIERLDRLDDPGVQRPPPLVEQAPVGDLVGQRVLEGVLEVREEARLVEELGGLEVGEAAAERSSDCSAMAWRRREGHVLADDRGGLEEALVLGREPVDARGQDRLRRRRDLKGLGRLRQAIGAALARQRLGLDQRPDALLEEEGVALGALDQQLLERLQLGSSPSKASSSSSALSGGKGSMRSWR